MGILNYVSPSCTSISFDIICELISLLYSSTVSESMRWQRLFTSIQLDLDEPHTLECDNAQTIRILTTRGPQLQTKLKHVDVHHLWLRQQVQRKDIDIKWTPTASMIADGFTKALDRQKHEKFVEQLGLVDIKYKLGHGHGHGHDHSHETTIKTE
jgi:hypothetical protein